LSNFISSASDRKRGKNKIKQLYNTTQRNEEHRQTFVHSLNAIYQITSISTVQQIEQTSNVIKSIRKTEKAWTKGYCTSHYGRPA